MCLISFFLKVYKLELVVSIRFHWYFVIEQEFCSLEWTTPVFQRFNDSTDTMSSERIQIERAMKLMRSRIKPPHSLIWVWSIFRLILQDIHVICISDYHVNQLVQSQLTVFPNKCVFVSRKDRTRNRTRVWEFHSSPKLLYHQTTYVLLVLDDSCSKNFWSFITSAHIVSFIASMD